MQYSVQIKDSVRKNRSCDCDLKAKLFTFTNKVYFNFYGNKKFSN